MGSLADDHQELISDNKITTSPSKGVGVLLLLLVSVCVGFGLYKIIASFIRKRKIRELRGREKTAERLKTGARRKRLGGALQENATGSSVVLSRMKMKAIKVEEVEEPSD